MDSCGPEALPPTLPEKPAFRKGDKIEARYRGKIYFYAGRISKVHSDGTYDIDYNDGTQ